MHLVSWYLKSRPDCNPTIIVVIVDDNNNNATQR